MTYPLRGVSVSGGSVEVTAYGGDSEYCQIGWWGGSNVQVYCYANGGAPADSMFTLSFSEQSPIGTPSYQYAWANDPWSSSYTPSDSYQKGTIATLPKMSPTGSNVKVTAYGGGGETCKVVGWWGDGATGTE